VRAATGTNINEKHDINLSHNRIALHCNAQCNRHSIR